MAGIPPIPQPQTFKTARGVNIQQIGSGLVLDGHNVLSVGGSATATGSSPTTLDSTRFVTMVIGGISYDLAIAVPGT